jgi:preprotein translocase subunit SecG
MNIYQLFQILWAASAFLIIVFVLLHSPKGDGLGGIGGQSQLFTSTKSAETTLNRITWSLCIIFMTTTIALSAGWIAK